jgi:hypothetical protein
MFFWSSMSTKNIWKIFSKYFSLSNILIVEHPHCRTSSLSNILIVEHPHCRTSSLSNICLGCFLIVEHYSHCRTFSLSNILIVEHLLRLLSHCRTLFSLSNIILIVEHSHCRTFSLSNICLGCFLIVEHNYNIKI